jgi:rhodanese-related sulfurtransferase
MPGTISRDELKEKIENESDRFLLVETLPAERYEFAHLPGAINLPPDRIANLAPALLPNKQAEIVVYCASPTWHASENAARDLAAMGYTNVRDYEGGKQDWIDAGLPIVSRHVHEHEHQHSHEEQPKTKDATTNPEEDVAWGQQLAFSTQPLIVEQVVKDLSG